MQRFTLITLGCKVNQYDGNAVSLVLRRAGWTPAEPQQQADLAIINTCCVTSTAMAKSRQAIRRAVRKSPNAAIIVLGCYSDYDAAKVLHLLESSGIPSGRALVAGHRDNLPRKLEQFVSRLATASRPVGESNSSGNDNSDVYCPASTTMPIAASIRASGGPPVKGIVATGTGLSEIDRFEGHQRAFVKVQDGCDAFCSYCIVPYLRRRVWSRSAEQIEQECRTLVAAGHKEIVLSGVFLGAFGRDTTIRRRWDADRPDQLPSLVRRIGRIDGLWRLRLSSLEPADVSDELLGVCAELPTFAPHFHLPLQSGSQQILRKMNRQYTADAFRAVVERINETFDRPAISSDIIVGFPEESEADFTATLEMARCASLSRIHAFPFSAIEPTVAWHRRELAPPTDVVRERLARLDALRGELASAYAEQFVGEQMEGLVEQASAKSAHRQTMTDRYLRVTFDPSDRAADLTGQVVRLHINAAAAGELTGTLCQ